MAYLMKCGHVANAYDRQGHPVCVICDCTTVEKECSDNDGLDDRQASCSYCGRKTDSRWELPFFKYKPNDKYDSYYCGCRGWD